MRKNPLIQAIEDMADAVTEWGGSDYPLHYGVAVKKVSEVQESKRE